MKSRPAAIAMLIALLTLGACAAPPATTPAPPAETPPSASVPSAESAMVVTANPLATQAGIAVLERGGSAVDAAVAIEAVLSLVEPQSSGLAGGAFLMHFDGATGALTAYDGREVAPAGATERLFMQADGAAMDFLTAKNSGIATGVPGVVDMLALAHGDHGKRPWAENFERAQTLATEGFAISPRLHGMISFFDPYMPKEPVEGPLDVRDYFFNEAGEPKAVGTLLKNPAYAAALAQIAADPRSFYEGEIAREIVRAAQLEPRAGTLSLADMRAYRAQRAEPLCFPYRDKQLCGPPPPSSWLMVAMTMGLLERGPDFVTGGPATASNWALFAEAQRLAYADRDHFVGDERFVDVPVTGMLADAYLRKRAVLISTERAQPQIAHGDPWPYDGAEPTAFAPDRTPDVPGTTHFVVADASGNVVSMTASVESIFGTTRMAGGMFLNNQLTDFSRNPDDAERHSAANAVAPGKRPRSSMSPTIVLDQDGAFYLATGSPGGNSIPAYVTKTLVGLIDWQLTAAEAAALPNLIARGDTVRVEESRAPAGLVDDLRSYGHEVEVRARGENSGVSIVIVRDDGSLEGAADPRREGEVGRPRAQP